jgi:hypothetical protein
VDANGQALTPNRISSSLLYEWFTARRQACAWSGVRWAHLDARGLGATVSHLARAYPRIGAIHRSNTRDLAMLGPYGGTGLHSSPVWVARCGSKLAHSVHSSPDSANQPGHLEVSTLERFNNFREASFGVGFPSWCGAESGMCPPTRYFA